MKHAKTISVVALRIMAFEGFTMTYWVFSGFPTGLLKKELIVAKSTRLC